MVMCPIISKCECVLLFASVTVIPFPFVGVVVLPCSAERGFRANNQDQLRAFTFLTSKKVPGIVAGSTPRDRAPRT